jgi:Ran GTPase-activating protein (RanGAP) involved in mRNA processing and transport
VLKEPTPHKLMHSHLCLMLTAMQDVECHIKVLSLSNLGMDDKVLLSLSDLISFKSSIEQLDISSNGLSAGRLAHFFKTISDKNNLKSLNIAQNSGQQKYVEGGFDD